MCEDGYEQDYTWGQTQMDRELARTQAALAAAQQEIGARDVMLAQCCGLFPPPYQPPPSNCGCHR